MTKESYVAAATFWRVMAWIIVSVLAGCATPIFLNGSSQLVPGETFQDCEACPSLVVVEAGAFQMGTPATEAKREEREQPLHQVIIDTNFAMGRFEVTFDEWDACTTAGRCEEHIPDDQEWGRGKRPVINVSWDDAHAYLDWLSDTTGQSYRLPTEAEWEYAARGNTNTAYSFGDDEEDLCVYGNAADASIEADEGEGYLPLDCNDGYGRETSPVGSYEPNPFGLYDVHGNVWEWMQDCWNETYDGAPADGSAWLAGDCERRVLRSASWIDAKGGSLRSGHRGRIDVPMRSFNLGFRVVRELD